MVADASKPYAASAVIFKNEAIFVGSCHYKVKEKAVEQACPP